MKRFKFRLESVLKLRRFELEARQRDLGQALERSMRIERAMEAACSEAAERAAEFVARAKKGISAGRASLDQFQVQQAFRHWRIDELNLREARRLAEEARAQVTRANTKVLALEKLKERAIERHREETAREEMRELDEVAGRTRSLLSRLEGSKASGSGRSL